MLRNETTFLIALGIALAAASCSDQTKPSSINQPSRDGDPFVLIKSDFKVGELAKKCDDSLAAAQEKLNAIAAITPAARTADNTALALEQTTAELSDATTPLTFMGYVSPDPAISAEGADCEQKVNQYLVGIFTRQDLYDSIKDIDGRNPAEKRLFSETKKGFEKNGLKLSPETLAQVKDLKQRLAVLESNFSTNLNKDTTSVKFKEFELSGVPASAMGRFARDAEGNVIVTTKAPDFQALADSASISETRRKIYAAYLNVGGDANTKLLEQAVSVRRQIAKLMGYKTWADYRTDGRMARDGKTALDFLSGLRTKLLERNKRDLALLLQRKKQDDASATKLDEWDLRYYANVVKTETFSIDDETIREYFPADLVLKGIFEIYSELLGVNFVEVIDGNVWANGVKLYQIEDAKDERLIGYFFADMLPRDGKYDHFAAFPLISARVLPNGKYSLPVAAVVGNFTPGSNGRPSLLNHYEVETAFHEFGHIMHQTLTKAPYASLSGSNVAQDFVEAPSQMLENWVWNPEILSKLSSHYVTQAKLPKALLDGMIRAKDFNQGYLNSRQLTFGLFDLAIHTAETDVDVTAIYQQTFREVIGVEPIEGNHFPASFGHLMGGYDAGYYGYMWSLVYAQDMFTRFEAGGLLSTEVGADYRKWILEQGSMKEALDLVEGFLGRKSNADAFYRMLGIDP